MRWEFTTMGGLSRHWPPLLLAALVVGGLAIFLWQPVELATLMEWGHRLALHPATTVAIILAQGVLFTLALPGSILVWLIAPFQPPWLSVLVLVSGSILGALGARGLSSYLTRNWQPGPRARRTIRLLESRSDLLTQTALRALPGFPHSAINYAGGLLHLPLPTFTAAALIGLSCKWGVYASAVHGITSAAKVGRFLSLWELIPLFGLAALLLAGAWLRTRRV